MSKVKVKYNLLLVLTILCSCENSSKLDPCLKSLKIISHSVNTQGNSVIKIQGELRGLSKNLHELEYALEQSLGLPDDTFVGTVVFEENYPECFGYYVIDSRLKLNLDTFQLHSKVQVELEKIHFDTPVAETMMKQKNVEYMYIVKSMIAAE